MAEQQQVMSANLQFKLGFHKYFDVAMIGSVLIHLLGFLIAPNYEPEPYELAEEEIVVIEAPEEVTVPLPPVAVARPSIPISAEFADVEISEEADPEETILDTDVDINSPTAARLNYVDPSSLGDEGAFLSYSDPPMEKRIYKPDYPELARQAGIEGTVVSKVYIDETGKVIKVEVVQSPSEIFIEPVMQALYKSTFYPAKQRDIPVKSRIIVPFDFYINPAGR
ncbi:MAG: energy transducer TonB [Candidatus Eisenbacteria bacterium]|nr:energy transducer TonB [Candidatus Eisenbacteria bacterium]